MYPQSKAEQLIERDRQLAEAVKWKLTLLAVEAEMTAKHDAIPARSRWAADHKRRADFKDAIAQIHNGLCAEDGVIDPVMSALVGKPGLLQIDILIARLERECAELREHVTRWPTPDTTRPYRYKGRPDKARVDGRYLVPGEVVEINETRATAMADLFEPA